MKSTIQLYKIVAVISFIILVTVQIILVYNTYELKDEHFFSVEKNLINDLYSKSVRNDKVYPGAQNIVDSYIYRNMDVLEKLYNEAPLQFEIVKQKICDSIFSVLRAKCNMDSLFAKIVTENKLSHTLKYKLVIESISIAFLNNKYIPMYQKGIKYPLIDSSIQTPVGIDIGGKLKNPDEQNQITYINVTSPAGHSYQLSFSLYVDTPNRFWAILQLMLPTLIFSVLSILAVVLIYFSTFKNWLKQKKLAEMKSDFVQSITHEFHTPLATIQIANKNLQNEKIAGNIENIKPLTKIIERQSQRLQMLVSRVLDITVMDKSTLQLHEVYLNDLLDEILLDYRLKPSNGNVEIEFIKKAENRKVSLDKFWFTTMLLNIFENAIKYNCNKTKIIKVTTLLKKDVFEIHVSDNGKGMAPEMVQHIFDKFYRGDKGDPDGVSGLGLGLFYVKQCVNAHGWTLKVESKEGVGSKFIIIMKKNNEA